MSIEEVEPFADFKVEAIFEKKIEEVKILNNYQLSYKIKTEDQEAISFDVPWDEEEVEKTTSMMAMMYITTSKEYKQMLWKETEELHLSIMKHVADIPDDAGKKDAIIKFFESTKISELNSESESESDENDQPNLNEHVDDHEQHANSHSQVNVEVVQEEQKSAEPQPVILHPR